MSPAEMLDRLSLTRCKPLFPAPLLAGNYRPRSNRLDQRCHLAGRSRCLPSISEGLVLFAEHQTAGRGQRGNRWESAAAKGLWFSILLRPGIQLNRSGLLTVWAIEAIAEAIRIEFSLKPTIKLPNDVQIDGQKLPVFWSRCARTKKRRIWLSSESESM